MVSSPAVHVWGKELNKSYKMQEQKSSDENSSLRSAAIMLELSRKLQQNSEVVEKSRTVLVGGYWLNVIISLSMIVG